MPQSPPADAQDHYATLGVTDTAPHLAIQAAYRRIIRATHPDVAGADPGAVARAARVNAAWTVLKDPVRRARYDRERTAARTRDGHGAQAGAAPAATAQQLREAAARQSAYSPIRLAQRQAFSAASWRIGLAVVLIGALLLALVAVV